MLSQRDGGPDTDVSGPKVSTVGMCCLASQQSAGKAHVEVNTASGPYINHHMSSSFNKMYSLLCFPWTPNSNKLV